MIGRRAFIRTLVSNLARISLLIGRVRPKLESLGICVPEGVA